MMKTILHKLFLSLLFLCACSTAHAYDDYADVTRSTSNNQCNQTLTESFRNIEIVLRELSPICSLHVENATSYHLMLIQNPHELSEVFYNISGLISILIYDHDPVKGGIPVGELKDEQLNKVVVVSSNRIWLSINLRIQDKSIDDSDFYDMDLSVAYVAAIAGSLPVCNASDLENTENGNYVVSNHTFGSVAQLVCSEGYISDEGSATAVCSVVDNVLAWIPGTSECSSVCEHPPNVLHANANARMDVNLVLDSTESREFARHRSQLVSDLHMSNGRQDHSDTIRTSGSVRYDETQSNYSSNRDNEIDGIAIDSNTPAGYDSLTTQSRLEESGRLRTNAVTAETITPRSSNPRTVTHTLSANFDTLRTSSTHTDNDALVANNDRMRNVMSTLGTNDTQNDNDILRTNVSVSYTCNPPYVLSGLARIRCGLDSRGVPRWVDPPPSCNVPNCSETIIFRQFSGAIVNPSFPGDTLRGGSLVCTWQVMAPANSQILFDVVYVNLPDESGVGITILDTGGAMPVELLHVTNHSHAENVSSETSKVTVVYHGPSVDTTGYRGFYIQYVMRTYNGDPLNSNTRNESTPDTSSSTIQSTNDTLNTYSGAMTTLYREFAPSIGGSTLEPRTVNRQDLSQYPVDHTELPVSHTAGPVMIHNTSESITPTSQVSRDEPFNYTRESVTTQNNFASVPSISQTTDDASVNHVTEPVTIQINFTSVPPTSHVATEVPPNHITQQTTNQSTKVVIDYSHEPQTEMTNRRLPNESSYAVSASTQNHILTIPEVDDSDDVWKIGIGVATPLCVLVIVLVSLFVCFRKKYPVRMIIGREFTKYCNPQYAGGQETPQLVRENTSSLFTNRNSIPGKTCVVFENLGYSKDDVDEDREHQFLETKNRRFAEQIFDTIPAGMSGSSIDNLDTGTGSLSETSRKVKRATLTDADMSSHISHGSGRTTVDLTGSTSWSSSSGNLRRNQELFESDITARSKIQDVSLTQADDENTSLSSGFSYNSLKPSSRPDEEEESGFMKTSMILFQQPTFEEVWAKVKARSRSLSLDRQLIEMKPRSSTVDPGKSARKMSLHGEAISSEQLQYLSTPARSQRESVASCASRSWTQSSATSTASSVHSRDIHVEVLPEKESKTPQPVKWPKLYEHSNSIKANDNSNDHTEDNEERYGQFINDVDKGNNLHDGGHICNVGSHEDKQARDDGTLFQEIDLESSHLREPNSNREIHSSSDRTSNKSTLNYTEPVNPRPFSTLIQTRTRCNFDEEQTKANGFTQNTTITPSVTNNDSPDCQSTSFSDFNDYNGSHPEAATSTSRRITPEQNTQRFEMAFQDNREWATSCYPPLNDVYNVNDDQTDGTDDESEGLKITDSDISDILANDTDEEERNDNDQVSTSGQVKAASLSETDTSIIFAGSYSDRDTDV